MQHDRMVAAGSDATKRVRKVLHNGLSLRRGGSCKSNGKKVAIVEHAVCRHIQDGVAATNRADMRDASYHSPSPRIQHPGGPIGLSSHLISL